MFGVFMKKFNKFFEFFLNKKIINIIDLENLYLNVDDKTKVYSFQKKYINQEKILYDAFGSVNTILPGKIKIIVIADTHNSLDEELLYDFVVQHPDYDLCLLLGDHSGYDVEKILKYISKEKIYALLGNHDSNYIEHYDLNNLNGKIVEVNGVKLIGIEGSFKYKPSSFPSFTQEGSVEFLNNKHSVDILVSHDGPFDSEKEYDPAHQGLFGITYYLFKKKIKYNIHGHLHKNYQRNLLNGTIEICKYGINYIELE